MPIFQYFHTPIKAPTKKNVLNIVMKITTNHVFDELYVKIGLSPSKIFILIYFNEIP